MSTQNYRVMQRKAKKKYQIYQSTCLGSLTLLSEKKGETYHIQKLLKY